MAMVPALILWTLALAPPGEAVQPAASPDAQLAALAAPLPSVASQFVGDPRQRRRDATILEDEEESTDDEREPIGPAPCLLTDLRRRDALLSTLGRSPGPRRTAARLFVLRC